MKPIVPEILSNRKSWASRLPLLLSALVLSLAFPARLHGQSAPTLIPFQARLTNQAGEAYDKGQYTLTFNLYDQAVGGSTVWTERHEKVGIVNGMVNVFLGSIANFPAWQPGTNPQVPLFTGTKYLGITVDADGNPATADPEMVPRTILVNAFHAQNASNLAGYNWSAILQSGSNNPQSGFIRADKLNPASITNAQLAPQTVITSSIADGAVTSDKLADSSISAADLAAVVREALVPPGTILPFGGTKAPTGFLMCDGAAYTRSGTYAPLFTAISTNFGAPNASSFNVPDLRGQFLRGVMPNLQATFSGSPSNNNITVPTHPFNRTGMAVRVTSPLTGLTAGIDYFVIVVDPNQIAFASSPANALAATKIALSGTASGMVVTQAEDPDSQLRLAMFAGGGIGSVIGSVQGDQLKSHGHQTEGFADTGNPDGSADRTNSYYFMHPLRGGSFRLKVDPTGGNETRPKNAYVNYIIKY